MATQNKWTAAWLIDFVHPVVGTVRASQMDLPDDYTALGGFYVGLLKSVDLVIATQLEDGAYGVDVPSLVSGVRFTARTLNRSTGAWDVHFDLAEEWRQCPVKIRHFDFATKAITTEFHGQVVDVNAIGGDVVFTFQSVGAAILDAMLPTQIVDASSFPTATDLGAPIPVVFGESAIVIPPYVGADDTATATDPGGRDYLVSWHDKCRIMTVWGDSDRYQSGLEQLSGSWTTAPGSPTYDSATTFTVSGGGDLSYQYPGGLPCRYKTTASGAAYVYDRISDYTTGTVTVALGPLDAGLNSVQIVPDYLIEVGRYEINSVDLTSIRLRADVQGGLVVECKDARNTSDTPYTNPVDIIKEILTNAVWGLGQSVNATSFTAAASAVASAWPAMQVDWALGWNGRQQKARDVLNSLLSLVEGILTYDAENDEWSITVQMAAPSAATLTFGVDDGYYNNCKPVSAAYTPISQATTTLKLRFCPGGRARDGAWTHRDYQYEIGKAVLSVGAVRTRTSDMLRDLASAKLVLDRWAKRLLYGDQKPVIEVGQEGRSVALAQLVTHTNTIDNLSGSWQVWRREKALGRIMLHLMGYNAAVYTDTSGDITSPTSASRDEVTVKNGEGSNLLRNPDFSTGARATTIPASTTDYTSIPGVYIQDTGSMLSAGAITTDFACVGGAKLAITATGDDGDFTSNVPRFTWVNTLSDPGVVASGFPCVPGEKFFLSLYCNVGLGFRFRVIWLTSAGALVSAHNPHTRVNSVDVNGLGWQRYHCVVRTPATAAYCYPELLFLTAATYQFDAAQFELAPRWAMRPTIWKPAVRYGIDPQQLNPGEIVRRPSAGDPEMYERMYERVSDTITLSGASTNITKGGAELFPAGAEIRAVLALVTTDITFGGGGGAWHLGTPIMPDAWGKDLACLTVGTGTTGANKEAVGSITVQAATHLIATPDAGTFTAGAIKCVAYLREYTRPTV